MTTIGTENHEIRIVIDAGESVDSFRCMTQDSFRLSHGRFRVHLPVDSALFLFYVSHRFHPPDVSKFDTRYVNLISLISNRSSKFETECLYRMVHVSDAFIGSVSKISPCVSTDECLNEKIEDEDLKIRRFCSSA